MLDWTEVIEGLAEDELTTIGIAVLELVATDGKGLLLFELDKTGTEGTAVFELGIAGTEGEAAVEVETTGAALELGTAGAEAAAFELEAIGTGVATRIDDGAMELTAAELLAEEDVA